jgi:hypothetical protein
MSMARQQVTLLLSLVLACAPARTSPERLPIEALFREPPTDSVPLSQHQAIWNATLRFYTSGAVATEGEYVDKTSRTVGTGPRSRSGSVALVLLTQRQDSLRPYSPEWLDSLEKGASVGICHAAQAQDCPDSLLGTFLTLTDPRRLPGDTVVVAVHEAGLNPALCRRQRSFVGYFSRFPAFVLDSTLGWHFVRFQPGFPSFAASGPCGPKSD